MTLIFVFYKLLEQRIGRNSVLFNCTLKNNLNSKNYWTDKISLNITLKTQRFDFHCDISCLVWT